MDLGEWSTGALSRKSSDRKGLKLFMAQDNWGPKPFRTFNCWLNDNSLKAFLDQFWCNNKEDRGNIQATLKKVKLLIKDWSKKIQKYN